MASRQTTVTYILDEASGAGKLKAKLMFGDYAVYLGDKIVALICDDQLHVKPTATGKHSSASARRRRRIPAQKTIPSSPAKGGTPRMAVQAS